MYSKLMRPIVLPRDASELPRALDQPRLSIGKVVQQRVDRHGDGEKDSADSTTSVGNDNADSTGGPGRASADSATTHNVRAEHDCAAERHAHAETSIPAKSAEHDRAEKGAAHDASESAPTTQNDTSEPATTSRDARGSAPGTQPNAPGVKGSFALDDIERGEKRFSALNRNGCIDFVIESGRMNQVRNSRIVSSPQFTQYLEMLRAHMSYWTNASFANFVLQQIVPNMDRAENVAPADEIAPCTHSTEPGTDSV